ncbi:hypothetical protein B0H63DRAFT_283103 [Podospora didyma]|uniref:Secreted protein n=1 Tax=Podospora didyma TaxID=330526 RepID=A0AAE0K8M3_9PEZI|nr:hypothetical protein B0H63DRAFT_283103 [Podospora didyma]
MASLLLVSLLLRSRTATQDSNANSKLKVGDLTGKAENSMNKNDDRKKIADGIATLAANRLATLVSEVHQRRELRPALFTTGSRTTPWENRSKDGQWPEATRQKRSSPEPRQQQQHSRIQRLCSPRL